MTHEGGPDFTVDIDSAVVEAIGEPGQRRFRIVAASTGQTTILWMEKQQLDALGRAIEQILMQLDVTLSETAPESVAGTVDLSTRNQFRVGRLEIGYDRERQRILIIAYDIEAEEGESPSLAGLFPLPLARLISEEAAKVVAAGRPRCVLCGMPMDPGPHACAEQNGHLINYG
jgi:uncharacterized repeat protein (TIGR03847 family)